MLIGRGASTAFNSLSCRSASGRAYLWGAIGSTLGDYSNIFNTVGFLSVPTAPIFGNWSDLIIRDAVVTSQVLVVLTADYKLYSAGSNSAYTLGTGAASSFRTRYPNQITIPAGLGPGVIVTKIERGMAYILAITSNGKVLFITDRPRDRSLIFRCFADIWLGNQ